MGTKELSRAINLFLIKSMQIQVTFLINQIASVVGNYEWCQAICHFCSSLVIPSSDSLYAITLFGLSKFFALLLCLIEEKSFCHIGFDKSYEQRMQ